MGKFSLLTKVNKNYYTDLRFAWSYCDLQSVHPILQKYCTVQIIFFSCLFVLKLLRQNTYFCRNFINLSFVDKLYKLFPKTLCRRSLIFLIMAHSYYNYLKDSRQLYCKLSTSNKLVIKTGIQNPLDIHEKEKSLMFCRMT